MTGFLVNLLSPVFSSLGVSQADLTSYIEKLIGYVIAILALLVVMIVVMVVAHKAKKGFRHVIRWQAAIAFIAIVAVLVNVICYGHDVQQRIKCFKRKESSTCTRDYRPEPCNHSEGC